MQLFTGINQLVDGDKIISNNCGKSSFKSLIKFAASSSSNFGQNKQFEYVSTPYTTRNSYGNISLFFPLYFIDQTINGLIQKIVSRLINSENNHVPTVAEHGAATRQRLVCVR